MSDGSDLRARSTALLFALIFLALFVLHLPLLRLPYFWDEAGYYVPAARDLLLSGSLIPRSTVSNAHPPLVMAYLALAWRLAGCAPAVTRTAMLLLSSFCLLGLFRLARRVAGAEVAIAVVLCSAIYPVFFAQSSLAHLDMAAAAFTFLGLLGYADEKPIAVGAWFSLAVLSKETAIVAPAALLAWECISRIIARRWREELRFPGNSWARVVALISPVLPLALWYAYHYNQTGFLLGNPEFFRYNVQATLHPLRILFALGMRLWQVLVYMNLYLLTIAALLAMWRPAMEGRERITLKVQFAFLSVIFAYVIAMAVIGGAVLARYMLPVTPLIILLCASTLRRRVLYWRAIVAIAVLGFGVALFVNPPYGFSMEDNLAYRDYILLHQHAESFLASHYSSARVLTAWPASDEITRPYLGYVTRPMRVLRIEDFTVEQLMSAAESGPKYDVALVFSIKYEPAHPWFEGWHRWQHWKTEFFGYHRDVPPAAAAQILAGQLVYAERRKGQWVGVIETQAIQEARRISLPSSGTNVSSQ